MAVKPKVTKTSKNTRVAPKTTKKNVKARKSRSIVSAKKGFSLKKLVIAGLSFAVIGTIWLFVANAASKITAESVMVPAAEGSGLVASVKYPGVFWWIRDGGDATAAKPRDAVYAVKFDAEGNPQPVRGTDKFPFYMVSGSKNNNWEDIALDDQNNIWIGDIGANDCGRDNQKIMKVKEPEPSGTETLTILASYTFKFPDPASGCNTWNSESMFWLDGKMYIFAKTSNSPVYRMDLPSGTSGTATLTRIGTLAGGVSNISVSSISDDRSRLMVASHEQMRVYKTTNTSLKGDALVKDLISKTPSHSATFDCGCGKGTNVEGGSFKRNSYDVAFIAESKYLFYAKPAGYGDSSTPTPPPTTPPPVPGGQAPVVSIASPAANAVVKGIITINVNATDDVAVTRVEILYDGTSVIRNGTAQGTYGWGSLFDTTKVSDGVHTIKVTAYDASNLSKTVQVPINVKNTAADTTVPSVSVTSPAVNATVSGKITINVNATDAVGVTRVDIFYDGTKVIREGLAQGTYGWGSQFDTTKVGNGAHTLTVKAYDAAGNMKQTDVPIKIKN